MAPPAFSVLFLLLLPVQGSSAAMSLTLHGVTDTLSPENQKYAKALEIAGRAFEEAEELFTDPTYHDKTGWKKDEYNNDGDTVYAKKTPKGKIVTVSTELPGDVHFVMEETWKGVETLPKWNKNINFASTVASPTEHFDIITYGNNDVLIVSGRDFVSARIYRRTHEGYIMASRSVELPEYPEVEGKVRAELVLAGARFRAHPTKANTTLADVVMLADLKGMLPRLLVNQVLGKIMLMDTETNKQHFAELAAKNDKK